MVVNLCYGNDFESAAIVDSWVVQVGAALIAVRLVCAHPFVITPAAAIVVITGEVLAKVKIAIWSLSIG